MASSELIAQTILNGLLLGGIYAVAALGLSLVFGITDIVNLAHGHMLMVGGYVAVLLFEVFGLTPLVGMLVAIALLFVFGVVVQRILLEPIVDEGLHQPIIVLFGVALVLQNLGRFFLGGDARSTDLGISGNGFSVGSLFFSFPRTVTFVVAVTLVVLMWAFLKWTKTGRAIRATAQNRTAARYVGIDTEYIYVVTFGIGAALAGVGGALLSMLFPIDPFIGWSYLLTSFAVVVLGGVGSVPGTLLGGLILGVSENLGALYLGGSYRDIVTFTIFLAVLIARPEGLFGNAGGEE